MDSFHITVNSERAELYEDARLASSLPTSDFAKRIVPPGRDVILPPGCIYHTAAALSPSNVWEAFVVEQEPTVRRVWWDGLSVQISLPYVVFVIGATRNKFQRAYVGFRNTPLSNVSEHLYRTPLLNTDSAGGICVGNPLGLCDPSIYMPMEQRPSAFAKAFLSTVWNTNFNRDMGEPRFAGTGITDILDWQEKTKEDPLFALSVHWERTHTVSQYIEAIIYDPGYFSRAIKLAYAEVGVKVGI